MKCYLQFITIPTADTPGTLLLLHFDNKRYLVGHIAEGTQRACIERGIGLRKVSDVLLTGRTEWATVGGLLGLVLTVADSKEAAVASMIANQTQKDDHKSQRPQAAALASAQGPGSKTKEEGLNAHLNLYGGPNLNHTIATSRRFIFRKGLPLNAKEYGAADVGFEGAGSRIPDWTDDNIRVYVLPLLPAISAPTSPARMESSPRKRSYEEANEKVETLLPTKKLDGDTDWTLAGHREQYAQMRKAVVSDMFESSWRLDRLTETSLHDVQLPAKIFIRNPVTKGLEEYTGPLPGESEDVPNITVLVRKPWPGALVHELPPTEPNSEAISYIIRNHPQRGRFLPKKAEEYGIKSGPGRSQLAKGYAVLNDSGETITPDMVLEPGKQGSGVVIVDLPTLDYVETFLQRPEWASSADIMEGVGAFIWILGHGVASDSRLQQFQQERPKMHHIISSPDYSPNILSLESAATAAVRHNLIDSKIFAIPLFDQQDTSSIDGAQIRPSVQAQRGLVLGLEPKIEIREVDVVKPLDTAQAAAAMSKEVLPLKSDHDHEQALANGSMNSEHWTQISPNSDAEIITLGTGSALPSKYRNVSATLVRVPGCGSYLLDCGENTLGTLMRLYAPEELREVLKDLKMIWISHLHADHHLGTTSVIKAWYRAVHNGIPGHSFAMDLGSYGDDRLAVISDTPMLHWLQEYASVEDYGYSRILPLATTPTHPDTSKDTELRLTPTSFPQISRYPQNTPYEPRTVSVPNPSGPENTKVFLNRLNLTSLESVYVNHCRGAQAVSITCKSGFKFSYSGDCRPSYRDFALIGIDSHVLIHEATFEDELQGDAEAKKHSTVSEALSVAEVMRAKACILTHFSQRYQKIPLVNENTPTQPRVSSTQRHETQAMHQASSAPASHVVQPTRPICVVAFDYMRVKVRDLPRLEKLQPLLNRIYARLEDNETLEDIETKEDAATTTIKEANWKPSKRSLKRAAASTERRASRSRERKSTS